MHSALKLKKGTFFSPGLPIHFKGENGTIESGSHLAICMDYLETAVASSCKFVHVMRVTSDVIGFQQSLYALW